MKALIKRFLYKEIPVKCTSKIMLQVKKNLSEEIIELDGHCDTARTELKREYYLGRLHAVYNVLEMIERIEEE